MTPPHPTQGIVSSLKKVAEAFDVREDTVKKEWRKKDMPGRPGRWDLAAIAEWKRLREKDPDDDLDDETKAMRRRKLALETEIKDLEARKRARLERAATGELISRTEVEAEVAQALQRIRRGLGTVPRLFAPRLPLDLRTDLVIELQRLIDQVLSWLVVELQQAPSQPQPEGADKIEAQTPQQPPAKRQRRRKSQQPDTEQPAD